MGQGRTDLPETVFLIGDKGFDGREWHRAMTELKIVFARPDKRNEHFKHGGRRQRIEAIRDTFKNQLTLEDHKGRTLQGVFSRCKAAPADRSGRLRDLHECFAWLAKELPVLMDRWDGERR